jgi:hypothetical protein
MSNSRLRIVTPTARPGEGVGLMSDVIDLSSRRKKPEPEYLSFQELEEKYRAITPDERATFNERYHVYPWPWAVLDGLSFVDPAPPPGSKLRRNCWTDKPTDSGCEDHQRGQRHAKMLLSAMRANDALGRVISARALEIVFESMIQDAMTRQKKGGKHSRTVITSAMTGFLSEITRVIAGVEK